MNMNINNFADDVMELIKENVGEEYKIEKNEITKTNDVKLQGLLFVQNGKNYGPTIYLNQYFSEYENQDRDLNDIVDEIIKIVDENKTNQSVMCIGNAFHDYEDIKDKIYLKILNKDMNQHIVMNSPYEEVLDLIIVPYIKFSEDADAACTATVNNQMLAMWEVSKETVIADGKANMSKNKFCFKNMSSVIGEIMMQNNQEVVEDLIPDDNGMYVLTATSKCNGAYYGFDNQVLSKISERLGKDKKFVLLPSSIHEVIILNSDIETLNKEELKQMVYEVNTNEVDEQEILSYSVYYYDPIEKTVKIA